MTKLVPKITRPELFFGFVAPIGARIDPAVSSFRQFLESHNYKVIEVKVTNTFKPMVAYVKPEVELLSTPLHKRYDTYIKYGNQLRRHFDDDSILAAAAIGQVIRKRTRLKKEAGGSGFEGVAYLIHQFKRKEEIELFRAVYGRLFFQISVYSRRGARVDALARKFAASENSGHLEKYRAQAEEITQIDEEEVTEPHGQRVGKIFHDADFVITLDNIDFDVQSQVNRFCEVLFSSNNVSPTKMEYGMFAAKGAALRTLDLSRQVGAAIFTPEGEIVALGSNEVPKGTGGTYWPEPGCDAREHTLGHDSNEKRKRQLLSEILQIVDPELDVEAELSKPSVRNSQLMDALEYGRIVHAEMSAICDAARLGLPVKGATMFCTTFPCHMCAKHLIAAGVGKLVFLEPYPKSLAYDLHSDALHIEGSDRGQYAAYPAVQFEHFYGITPRRYREFFARHSRKNKDGSFRQYINDEAVPNLDIKVPFYLEFEGVILDGLKKTVAADFVFDTEG